MNDRVVSWTKTVATWLERLFAVALMLGVVVFAAKSATMLVGMDWRESETFYELIYRLLLVVIGVELVRTLVTHDLGAVLELLAFVVARKLLKPDLTTIEIGIGIAAFVALVAARRFFLRASPTGPLEVPISE